MSEPEIRSVSDTAFLIAHFRAAESERQDALFHDPLAARLAGETGRRLAESFPTRAMTGWMTAVRTVVIDALVRDAITQGIDTVLCLGAGLDTRPYRLALPSELCWIEADYPGVVAYKEERLAGEVPRCRMERIGADLADAAARRALWARVAERAGSVLVLTEGLIPYLDNAQVGTLADELRALPAVKAWIADYVSPESHIYREHSGLKRAMRNAPLRFRPDDWFGFFAAHGWRAREVRYLPEEGERLARPAPLPRRMRWVMRLLAPFAPPSARERFARFSGYALLEPVR